MLQDGTSGGRAASVAGRPCRCYARTACAHRRDAQQDDGRDLPNEHFLPGQTAPVSDDSTVAGYGS